MCESVSIDEITNKENTFDNKLEKQKEPKNEIYQDKEIGEICNFLLRNKYLFIIRILTNKKISHSFDFLSYIIFRGKKIRPLDLTLKVTHYHCLLTIITYYVLNNRNKELADELTKQKPDNDNITIYLSGLLCELMEQGHSEFGNNFRNNVYRFISDIVFQIGQIKSKQYFTYKSSKYIVSNKKYINGINTSSYLSNNASSDLPDNASSDLPDNASSDLPGESVMDTHMDTISDLYSNMDLDEDIIYEN